MPTLTQCSDRVSGIFSGSIYGIDALMALILCDILSDILAGIYYDILSDILSGMLSRIYPDILSDILSGIYSDIIADILPAISHDILSSIISGIYFDLHSFRHSICHLFWHSFWRSIWHSLRHAGPGGPSCMQSSRYGSQQLKPTVTTSCKSSTSTPEARRSRGKSTVGERSRRRRRRSWEGGDAPLLKSRGPHLAGGEKCESQWFP